MDREHPLAGTTSVFSIPSPAGWEGREEKEGEEGREEGREEGEGEEKDAEEGMRGDAEPSLSSSVSREVSFTHSGIGRVEKNLQLP